MSAGHNKYVLQPSRYKVLCMQASTDMSSSPVHTRHCVCSPQQICLLGWRTYLLWCTHKTLYYWAGRHICCDLQTQYLVTTGRRTYLLWLTDTIHCLYWTGGHICCSLQQQYIVYTGLEDIFVVARRHNTLYIH